MLYDAVANDVHSGVPVHTIYTKAKDASIHIEYNLPSAQLARLLLILVARDRTCVVGVCLLDLKRTRHVLSGI